VGSSRDACLVTGASLNVLCVEDIGQHQQTAACAQLATLDHQHLGLDRYQYSVSVSGRYQWYRFGIGITDTAADTRTDTGRP